MCDIGHMSNESSPNPGAGKSCCGCLVIVVVFLFIIGSCGALFSGSGDENDPVEEDAVVETDTEGEEVSEPDEMPELVGMTVAEAEGAVKELHEYETSLNKEDITGNDRSIWDSENWIVCSQSVAAGEDFNAGDDVTIEYSREEEGCATASEWAQQVEKQWMASLGVESWSALGSDYSRLSAIQKVSSEEVGTLRIDMGNTGLTTPEVAQWGDNLDIMINSSLTDTAEVYTVHVYVNGERASASETTSGLDEVSARIACEMYLESQFPYGSKIHWVMDNNGSSIVQDGTVWQMGAGVTLTNEYNAESKHEIVCLVGGSNDSPQVVDFELR